MLEGLIYEIKYQLTATFHPDKEIRQQVIASRTVDKEVGRVQKEMLGILPEAKRFESPFTIANEAIHRIIKDGFDGRKDGKYEIHVDSKYMQNDPARMDEILNK